MNYVADRLAEKTSGMIGDALGTILGGWGLEPITTVTGLLSPTRTRLAVPEGGEAAVPVPHMDDTAREARRLGRNIGAGVYGGIGALAGLAAIPAVAAGALPAAALLSPLSLGLLGAGFGGAAGHVLSPMAARTKVRLKGDPYLRDRKDQTFAGQEVEKMSCLSVTAPGIADRLYAKTSGAIGDAYLSVLGAPAALPSAVMTGLSPARDAATGQPLPEESERQGRALGQLVGGGAGAAYGLKNYVTSTPSGPINRLLGRKPGLYPTLMRTALLGGIGVGLGGIAGAAGSRTASRLRGDYARATGETPAPAPSYSEPEYDYYSEE